ncbi:MAG: 16S rRNA (cytosine(967)-C(5))-methyltransferase RsmB [Ruminococcus sp.]|nr:16S rRNA (cytosine(967)-C(5))-methyltransferase RsmB [Ruminococcus sp.]
MPNVRKIAYTVLCRVLNEGAYSALAINAAVKEHALDKRDTSFLSALVYGVLERLLTLDEIIRQYSSIRLKKIEKKTLLVLRLGVYQLIFMDKIPDSAAVDESVKLIKKLGLYQSSGFVNAVLRAIIRNDKRYTLPDESDTVRYLSIRYSCPEELVTLFLNSYGKENTVRILEDLSGRPPITIRVNALKTTKKELKASLTEQGITAEDISFLENSLHLDHTGSLEDLREFQDGLFYVQDAASQLSCEILGAKEGETLCDVCSAPGGKSFYSAIRMNNKGRIFSYDIYPHKTRLIEKSAQRLGIDIITASVRDASKNDPPLPACDRVLCDVPCSGLGILRRKPEIRYKKDTNIDFLPHLQYSILCMSVNSLPTGGEIVYSTCTLNPKENREVVERFLSEHEDFAPADINLPEGFTRMIDEPSHLLTILPGFYNTDGFFVAKLRKVSS